MDLTNTCNYRNLDSIPINEWNAIRTISKSCSFFRDTIRTARDYRSSGMAATAGRVDPTKFAGWAKTEGNDYQMFKRIHAHTYIHNTRMYVCVYVRH